MKKIYLIVLALSMLLTGSNALPPTVTASGEDVLPMCQVHGEALKKERVRVEYGFFDFNVDWLIEGEELFPNAQQFITGGCKSMKDILEDGSCARRGGPKYQEVWYCQKCRAAEKEWLKARGIKGKPYSRTWRY